MKDHFKETFEPKVAQVEPSEHEKKEKLTSELLEMVPKRFNQYIEDIAIIAKNSDNSNLLGVTYDKETDTLTGVPVYELDRFVSAPPLMGRMGREVSTRATVESDVIATIERDHTEADGEQEDLYLLSLRRYNAQTHGDTWGAYQGKDGDLLMQVALRPSKQEVTARVRGLDYGHANSQHLQTTIDTLNKSIPKTT